MVNDYQENYGLGWISLYRSIKNHWVFENEKYLKWWIIMLFEVNHHEKKITRYYEVYIIKKGQSCNCIRTWSNLFNCSTKTVTKFFKMLEKDEMISLKKLGKGKQALTLVNITNYGNYQDKKKQGLLQGGNTEETQRKQGLPTNNNDNNDNNDNKYNIPSLEDFSNHAKKRKPNVDLESVKLKYYSWVDNNWRDGNNKEIKNWKSKLTQTLRFLETEKPKGLKHAF